MVKALIVSYFEGTSGGKFVTEVTGRRGQNQLCQAEGKSEGEKIGWDVASTQPVFII
jgi:hypothetical protein